MKRKLIAILMAMTLVLSCGMVAVADEPSEEGTEMSQVGDDGGEGEEQEEKEEEKETVVSEASADTSMDENVISEDNLKELQENAAEKQNPTADGENAAEKQNPTADGENAVEGELPVDETHFPDAAFREYINEKVDKDQNGSLSKEEIEAEKSMIFGSSNYNVRSFKGIEYFTSLEFFVFNGFSLESLDLSKNTKIHEGKLSNCQITNLIFNSELKGLGYYDSQITNLDVSNLKLTMLWCRGNLPQEFVSIPTLEYIKLYDDMHLPYLDLSIQKNMRTGDDGEYGDYGTPGHRDGMGGAYLAPQTISRTVTSVNGVWTLNMASIVGKDYLDRVTLVTEGAEMSRDGLVTFSGSEIPTELAYNFDTKNPAKTTMMEVTVLLSGVKDQTKEEVSIDTSELDLDRICKEHNVDPGKAEIVLSQETPDRKDTEKLTPKAGANGYSFVNAYEVLMSLYSDGNKIADITENFGKVTLTLQAGKNYAGYHAVVYQLHNGEEIIPHEGLTVDAEGMVTITVDKFSTFAVSVRNKSSVNNSGQSTGNNQTLTNTPNNQTATNTPDNSTPTFSRAGTNTSNAGSVKTGDPLDVVLWSMLCMISVGACMLLVRKKYYKHS